MGTWVERGWAMNRKLGAALLLFALGCHTTPHATLPPEPVVRPVDVNGVAAVINDQRLEWEKKPFSGRVTLYQLGGTTPDPWTQLANETAAIITAMPERPARVEVCVTSFRLVYKQSPKRRLDPSDSAKGVGLPIQAGGGKVPNSTKDTDYAPVPSDSQGLWSSMGLSSVPKEANSCENPISEDPTGTSCTLRASVRIIYPGGREKTVNVSAIATGDTDSKYMGEARSMAVKGVLRQFSFQFREAVGAP